MVRPQRVTLSQQSLFPEKAEAPPEAEYDIDLDQGR
jgi:hypothetical protein